MKSPYYAVTKILSKILALSLVLLLNIIYLPISDVNAAVNNFQVTVNAGAVAEDGTVTIPVAFKNVSSDGIVGVNFKLLYDSSAFAFTSVTPGTIVPAGAEFSTQPAKAEDPTATPQSANGSVAFVYVDSTGGSNPITTDGNFAVITLKERKTVKPGTYTISLDTSNPDMSAITDSKYTVTTIDNSNFTSGTVSVSPIPAPTISGVSDGSLYTTAVTPSWTDAAGTTSTATLNGVDYKNGTTISDDDTYTLVITTTKTSSGVQSQTTIRFTVAKGAPEKPVVSGVEDGKTYSVAVTPTWTDATGTTSTATLTDNKKGTTINPYTSGTAISDDGDYTLVVTATKTSNKLTASTTVHFTIDKVAPVAPVVTGVADGNTYSVAVTPNWTDATGTTSIATLDGSAYTKGTAISSNGSHTLVVTATKTSNGLSTATTVKFTIDKDAPASPVVSGVEDGKIYAKAVTPTWDEVTGVTTTATLNGASYTKGNPISNDGSYTLIVTATKTSTGSKSSRTIKFTIDSVAPSNPIVTITGATHGDTEYSYSAATPVKATWADAVGTTSVAKLSGNDYKSGDPITKDGTYKLVITTTKNNGLTNIETVDIVVDSIAPTVSSISGVANGKIYPIAVTPNWADATGTTSTATLNGKDYLKGTQIKDNGDYVLVVTSTKVANGMTTATTISFKIDTVAPASLVVSISGATNGTTKYASTADAVYASTYSGPVSVTFVDAPRTTSVATLNGSNYVSGTQIPENGKYWLHIITTKDNSLTVNTDVYFTVDSVAPSIPTIAGVADKKVYATAVTPSWTDSEGTTSAATLNDKAYTNGTKIADDGSYKLIVTSTKIANGMKATSTVNFKIDSVPPTKPDIKVTGLTSGTTTYSNANDKKYVATYSKPVLVTITDAQGTGTTSAAKLNGKDYTSGSPITEDGKYDFVVTSSKDNGLTTESSVYFTVYSAVPAVPVVTGVNEGSVYINSVTPKWVDAEGTTSTAKLNGKDYTKGTEIKDNASYTLAVTSTFVANGMSATKTVNFKIDNVPPSKPTISVNGKTNGTTVHEATYDVVTVSGPASITIADIAETGTMSTATLDGKAYTSGAQITADGQYKLLVTSSKDNGLTVTSAVYVIVDSVMPADLTISGIADGGSYTSSATPTWTDIAGATITATLDGNPYTKGTAITSTTAHKLVVTVTRTANGATKVLELNFNVIAPIPTPSNTTTPTAAIPADTTPKADNGNQNHKDADKKADELLSTVKGDVDSNTAANLLDQVANNAQAISVDKAKEVISTVIDKLGKVDSKVVEKVQAILANAGRLDVAQTQSTSDGKTVAQVDSKTIDATIDNFSKALSDVAQKIASKSDDADVAKSIKENAKVTLAVDDKGAADIKLPAESVKKLHDAGIGVEVITSDTKLNISSKAIDNLALQDGQSVVLSKQTLNASAVTDLTNKIVTLDENMKPTGKVFSIGLTVTDSKNNQTQVHNFNDTLKITLKLSKDDLKGITDMRKASVYYVKEDGTSECEDSVVTVTGATFDTNHLSNYTIMQCNKTFKDIKNSWAKDPIEVLAAKHVINGIDKAQTTFDPTGKLTRAQLVSLIARSLGLKAKAEESGFSDVAKNAWYSQSVIAAKEAGIISGDNKGKFNPDKLVTREEMAKMIVTAYEYKSGRKASDIASKSRTNFKDMNKISTWAVDYVKAAKVLNLISGMSNGNYNPKDNSQRDQAAKVIYSMLSKLELV